MFNKNNYNLRHYGLFFLFFFCAIILLALAPIPQDPLYHHFADTRTILGIPNALNVISNFPFLLVGLLGLRHIIKNGTPNTLLYFIFFTGIFSVSLGSSYYHLNPNNNTLVWDRIPMTVGFMAFFCSVIAERVSVKLAYRLVAPLLILGVFSVWYWHHYQIIGQGDLRLYVFVQFFPMLAIPYLLLVYPAQYSQSVYLWSSLASY